MSAWLPLILGNVPAKLREAPRWIGWRGELGADGRWKKPPFQIGRPCELASNADPEHWRSEGDVREVRALAPELFDGFGIALTGGTVFIDLDHVRDPETGVIEPWAMQMVETFDSWSEVSVSGTGIHIFCLGQLAGSAVVNYL